MAVIRTSRRTAGRPRASLAALAAGITVLAGCHAGQQAQTAEQIPTIDGNYAQVGPLALRDVTIGYPETGSWPQGSDAPVHLVVVNESRKADALVEVRSLVADGVTLSAEPAAGTTATASAAATPSESASPSESATESASPGETASPSESGSPSATAEPTPTEGSEVTIPIPGATFVSFRDDGPEILLTGLRRMLRPAQVVPITFVFAEAGEVTVNVAVAVPTEEISPAPTVPAEGRGEAGAEHAGG